MFLCCFLTVSRSTNAASSVHLVSPRLILCFNCHAIKNKNRNLQKVQNVFLETLPAKPLITSRKNRLFRRQQTYYAMKVFFRWDNKLLFMTRRNTTAIWCFPHLRSSRPVARVYRYPAAANCFQKTR